MTAPAAQDTGNAAVVISFRSYQDALDLMKHQQRNRSEFIRDMADAGLNRARCYRCLELVEVEYGDLAGKPLAQWVEEAGKEVTRQHRTGHHPITVGRDAGAGVTPRCGEPMRGQKACGRPAGHSGHHYSEEAWQQQNDRIEGWRREGRYPVRTHSASGYNRGCRCEVCTAAHAERARDERAAKSGMAPSRPAPGSAMFMEPGGSPVITAAVPDRKKGSKP